MNLLDEVRRNYPDLVAQRYKLDAETLALPPYELMEAIGRKRGLLVRGGEVNTERCAIMLVDEFRACKWGRISLVSMAALQAWTKPGAALCAARCA